MKLVQDVEYIVTKPSNDGTFRLGDKIALKADGRVWIGDDYVEPSDVAVAVEGMECDTFVLTSRIPNTIEILQAIHDNIDSTCHECESRVAKYLAAKLLEGLGRGTR